MAFYESPRFPDDISYGATGGPGYLTDVTGTSSGKEYRNAGWSQARATYDVSHAAREPAKYAVLLAYFRAMRGRLHGFRFKDWSDFAAASGEGILTQIGVTTTYQMYKRYSAGSASEDRLISKPVSGSVTISGGGTYAIDTTTGIVTKTAGAAPTGWVGQFDVPCRFDVDKLDGRIIDRSASGLVMGWENAPIIEIRV